MKSECEDLGACKYRVRLEIEPEKFEEAKRKLAKRYAHLVEVKGFRPGKAPLELVMRKIGPVLIDEARQTLADESLHTVLEERGIRLSSTPNISLEEDGPDGSLRFSAEFEGFPKIDPKDYLGIEVQAPLVPPVSEEDVDKVLEDMRHNGGRYEPKGPDSVAMEGDLAECEVTLQSEDGSTLLGPVNFYVRAGLDDDPVKDVGREILGMRVSESKAIAGEFGRLARMQLEKAGKDEINGIAVVQVRALRALVLPELDDEFAKNVSERETLAELREDVRRRLEESRQQEYERLLKEAVIDAAVKANPIQVGSQTMDNLVEATEYELKRTLLPHLSPEERDEVNLRIPREASQDHAMKVFSRFVVLKAIEEKEGITVTKEEVDTRLREIAEAEGMPLPKLRARISQDELKEQLAREKTIDLLMRYAVVKPATDSASANNDQRVIITDSPAPTSEEGQTGPVDAPK